MLNSAKLQTIVLTSRPAEAETFYCDTLDLPLRNRSDGALVFDVGGAPLRVAPVESTTPSEHTVLGFAVTDLNATIDWLGSRGVSIERIAGLRHDRNGIVTSPDGASVAWIRDPDGNLLSIVEFPDSNY